MLRRAAALLASAASAAAHGALTSPPSRNAVDRFLPGTDGLGHCNSCGSECQKSPDGWADPGVRAGGGGQPCLWFSQGCSIGCPTCTGVGSHSSVSLCNGTMEPTVNDPKLRTMNRGAAAGSAEDAYRYNPWRAPGSAPVNDACGMAGGTIPEHRGPGDAEFKATVFATMGDLGSKVLPYAPSGTAWTTGTAVEVAWGIRFNHGGGYQYRLCPLEEELTEACFQKHPLQFVESKQELHWVNGTRLPIKGTFVSEGTSPAGSTWAMNPIPRINFDSHSSGQPKGTSGCDRPANGLACRQFDPPCDEGDSASRPWHGNGAGNSVDVLGRCSGDATGVQIVDQVLIPADLPAGEYVLGFRWDCEESTQVWSSCADVTLCSPGAKCAPPPAFTPPPVPPTPPPPAPAPPPRPDAVGVWQPGTNFNGADVAPCGHKGCALNATSTRADCIDLCLREPACSAYTFFPAGCESGPHCWTKGGTGTKKALKCGGSEVVRAP